MGYGGGARAQCHGGARPRCVGTLESGGGRQAKKKDTTVLEDDSMSMDTNDTAARRLGHTRVPRTGKGKGQYGLTAEALEALRGGAASKTLADLLYSRAKKKICIQKHFLPEHHQNTAITSYRNTTATCKGQKDERARSRQNNLYVQTCTKDWGPRGRFV